MKIKLQILILLGIVHFANSQSLIRGPYLTMATSNSVVISWRTDLACNSKVRYGSQLGVYSGGTVNNNLVNDHIIKITGLQPSTKYYYTVGTSLNVLQGDNENYFKTLPQASSAYEEPIRILAVGDVAKATVNEERVRDAFLNYVDTNYIDAYLMLGDNAYPNGLDSEFQHGFFNYFQQTITKHTVLWPALGNHEYANDYALRQTHIIPYFNIFTLPTQGESGGLASNTEMYYSFDIGNIHFINLDSYGLEQLGGSYYGFSDTALSPQIQWLKRDLDSNKLPWVIVSFHHPPYCMGTHNSDSELDLVAIREKLNPILERYNVDLVLNGHCHTYQRSSMIHQHYGMEATYDTLMHRVQHTSAMSDGSLYSCPVIKNSEPPLATDSGVIYMVIGSGSAYPQTPQVQWPHNAMYYSNYADNGALLLTVTGNKLLAEWISTDTNQVVKDHFTIYKNVNRKKYLSIPKGQAVILNASWNKQNDFIWSTGDSIQQITIYPLSPQVITVSDKNNCIADSFFITIAPTAVMETDQAMMTISPNPVADKLYIKGLKPGIYNLNIIDSNGEISINKKISVTSDKQDVFIHIDQLANGQYLLNVQDQQSHVLNTKFIKNAE